MTTTSSRILVIAGLLLGFNVASIAAVKDRPDIGKGEFMDKCAVCHGQGATGNGGVTDLLTKAPSDLTVLGKKNNGVFPVDYVYRVIDGREVVMGHGSRDMPIWGNRYKTENVEAAEYYYDVPYNMEMFVRVRVLNLIDYLSRIQKH